MLEEEIYWVRMRGETLRTIDNVLDALPDDLLAAVAVYPHNIGMIVPYHDQDYPRAGEASVLAAKHLCAWRDDLIKEGFWSYEDGWIE